MTRRAMAAIVVAIVVATVIAACGSGRPSGTVQPILSRAAASDAATGSPVVRSPGPSVAASPPGTAGPPSASLSAEGGDPVAGALGSWTWGDIGEDSPFLAGTPIAAGAGEPLTVTFMPDRPVTRWRARYVTAGQGDAAGARLAGSGVGRPTFGAPPAGHWTLEIAVTFAGQGRAASYVWALSVA